MPTQPCPEYPPNANKIAQTLFLGASVAGFNVSMGWDGQPAQLTVSLVDDGPQGDCTGSSPTNPLAQKTSPVAPYYQYRANPLSSTDGHWDTCVGYNCFIDKKTNQPANTTKTNPQDLIAPGKVYYKFDTTDGIISKYYLKTDPGFFGDRTTINPQGQDTNARTFTYDIIDTPVYFKMNNFAFGGFVQSWSRNIDSGGQGFTVIINSAQSILNSCYLILDKFGGTIFSRSSSVAAYGSPKNYILARTANNGEIDYTGSDLTKGSIPNLFNIYGFLESHGIYNFGIARNNDRGLSANKILDALSVLTGITDDSTGKLNTVISGRERHAKKIAFSTFGRIISKCMQLEDGGGLFDPVASSFDSYGVIPRRDFTHLGAAGYGDRCQFVLDIYDVIYDSGGNRRFPDSFCINEPITTIGNLLSTLGEAGGFDFFTELVPILDKDNDKFINFIKVKVISRFKQPSTRIIEGTIKQMICNGYDISSVTHGKEKNESTARSFIIGGNQQRLLQIKSYRLAYSQSNFIYDPSSRKFVNYYSLNDPIPSANLASPALTNPYGYGKIKFPNFGSTRNSFLYTNCPGGDCTTFIEETNVNKSFNTDDPAWQDVTETINGKTTIPVGNYDLSFKQNHNTAFAQNGRWIPLYKDNICPFFGYTQEENAAIQTNSDQSVNNVSRLIRPVWYDAWTGQLAVVIRVNELPKLNVSLNRTSLETGIGWNLPYAHTPSGPSIGPYLTLWGNKAPGATEYFILTESEMRAALAGFDNYLAYSLAKTYKPDLIEMVRRAYFIKTRTTLIAAGMTAVEAAKAADQETNWYWKLMDINIGGDLLYPTLAHPDKNDGSQYIQEQALQDLQILHKFITSVAKYYGKKYMVKAPYLNSYRDEDFASVSFKTAAGYGYVFSGDGSLTYNYVPTNDGAWEEYGNLIDDCIPVGSPQWYQLTDDVGKIKPLLGYNSTPVYDYIREAKCKAANSSTFAAFKNWELHPYFDYQSWLMVYQSKTTQCGNGSDFIFPSVDLSTLDPSEFVTVPQINDNTAFSLLSAVAPGYFGGTNKLPAYDAFGKNVTSVNAAVGKTKTYVTASVEESYGFLGAYSGTLTDPRILIEGPGINLTSTNQESSKDVNRTVLSNCAIEDVITYMYVTPATSRDWSWMASMMNYACPIVIDDANNPYVLGLYTVSSNSSANNVELAPKAAHPFFAAIPIKSNQYVYGPWTNYPFQKRNDVFSQFVATFGDCSSTPPTTYTSTIRPPNGSEAANAINNFITDLNVDINEDYVPWNYGGSQALDFVVAKDIESKTNYQSVIETAQLDMVGLPVFNLAGAFNGNNINRFNYTPSGYTLTYYDVKAAFTEPAADPSFPGINQPSFGQTPSAGISNITTSATTYSLITLKNTEYDGPYITSMQSSITDQGLKTTYNFRTYTRKLGLFNREFTEKLKKLNLANLKRNNKINNLQKSVANIALKQDRFLLEQSLNKAQFGSSDLASKLFGWSPGTVLIGQAHSYIEEPNRSPAYTEDYSKFTSPGGINSRTTASLSWSVGAGDDQGDNSTVKPTTRLTAALSPEFLRSTGRIVSTVQLYERKEVEAQINKQYGSQSAMSLDGLLSPVSFFPTPKNGTFAYSKYNIGQCPFCGGAGVRTLNLSQYSNTAKTYTVQNFVCEHCAHPSKKLNAKLPADNEDTEANVPITCITYNPIIVPYGEFKNPNHQNYIGAHPEQGVHADLTSASPAYNGVTRTFQDRLRHCIEIVGRGSIPPSKMKYQLETSKNLTTYNAGNTDLPEVNLDYFGNDIALYNRRSKINDPQNRLYETNQRFMGLRGPLVLHSWGYDTDGYPVPNAADEPYAIDAYGRPMRFKLSVTDKPAKPYKDLPYGASFRLAAGGLIFSKTVNNEFLPGGLNANTSVIEVEIKDNLEAEGDFNPGDALGAGDPTSGLTNGYKGSIISKTQKFEGGKWTAKKRLKQFYLNWGERPDSWKVGPVDLRWDADRNVWTAFGSGAEEIDPPYIITNSNDIITLDEFIAKRTKKKYIYRMVYITLEEDLIKQPDFDETYVTRGFIDDIEFSTEPLALGFRRLTYLKDKTGYCAPKGTKLLCRYNSKTGFYEPVSKPVITTTGKITSSTQVLLNLIYTPSRRNNVVPTSTVNYINPLGFATPTNAIGIFSFIDSQWTLNSIKQ